MLRISQHQAGPLLQSLDWIEAIERVHANVSLCTLPKHFQPNQPFRNQPAVSSHMHNGLASWPSGAWHLTKDDRHSRGAGLAALLELLVGVGAADVSVLRGGAVRARVALCNQHRRL